MYCLLLCHFVRVYIIINFVHLGGGAVYLFQDTVLWLGLTLYISALRVFRVFKLDMLSVNDVKCIALQYVYSCMSIGISLSIA